MTPRKKSQMADIKIRMREPLRAAIEGAAKENSQSMNAEMVHRLERSFADQRAMMDALDLAYGRELTGLITALAEVMKAVGSGAALLTTLSPEESRNWWNNPFAYDQAVRAVNEILEALRPAGEITASAKTVAAYMKVDGSSGPVLSTSLSDGEQVIGEILPILGTGFARDILRKITETAKDPHHDGPPARMRRSFGPALVKRIGHYLKRISGLAT